MEEFIIQLTERLAAEISGPEGELFLAGLQVIGVLLGIVIVLFTCNALISIISYWRIFTKAGEKGWKCLIPVYSTYVEYKLVWSVKAFVIMIVVSVLMPFFTGTEGFMLAISVAFSAANLYFIVMRLHKLSKAFGHGVGFTIGLMFLNSIFMLILAFGKSRYVRAEQKLGEYAEKEAN